MRSNQRVICSVWTFLCWPVVAGANPDWQHFSSKQGDLEAPNAGKQQTSTAVVDVDRDGINDFVITERTMAPAVVWYRRGPSGWTKYVIEDTPLHIEAGTDAYDIDGDGDPDLMAGGDWQNNQLWWWENPYPNLDPKTPWKRREIKNYGKTKHHDQMFGDVDGDFQAELVFWAQGDNKLYVAEVPENPREAGIWESHVIYTWSGDGQMEQRGSYPGFKAINEHEGLAIVDIDLDGKNDIVGGGRWFKHIDGHTFQAHEIDAGYAFSRSAAGQLVEGGRPEVVLVVGDGWAPMVMYEWQNGTWVSKVLIDTVDNGHSIHILDFNGDGHLDIWNAEMRLSGENADAKNRLLLGDGKGNFKDVIITEGIGLHESRIADLDGDGDYDILGKPYGWDVPRVDVWLQNGTGPRVAQKAGAFSKDVGLELYSLRFEFAKDVPAAVALVRQMGFKEVEVSGYYGLSPEAFKALLDQNELRCRSMIFGYDRLRDDMERVIREAKLFGTRLVGVAWIPHESGQFSGDDAGKACRDLNAFGRQLKASGFTFFYHAHGYEFVPHGDGTLMDLIMDQTDAQAVTYQLDTFWVLYGGCDPLTLLKKYPNRFSSLHLKDLRRRTPGRTTGSAADETSVPLGAGDVSFPALLREAVRLGIDHYYIEDEAKDARDQIPQSLAYLRSLR